MDLEKRRRTGERQNHNGTRKETGCSNTGDGTSDDESCGGGGNSTNQATHFENEDGREIGKLDVKKLVNVAIHGLQSSGGQ